MCSKMERVNFVFQLLEYSVVLQVKQFVHLQQGLECEGMGVCTCSSEVRDILHAQACELENPRLEWSVL